MANRYLIPQRDNMDNGKVCEYRKYVSVTFLDVLPAVSRNGQMMCLQVLRRTEGLPGQPPSTITRRVFDTPRSPLSRGSGASKQP